MKALEDAAALKVGDSELTKYVFSLFSFQINFY